MHEAHAGLPCGWHHRQLPCPVADYPSPPDQRARQPQERRRQHGRIDVQHDRPACRQRGEVVSYRLLLSRHKEPGADRAHRNAESLEPCRHQPRPFAEPGCTIDLACYDDAAAGHWRGRVAGHWCQCGCDAGEGSAPRPGRQRLPHAVEEMQLHLRVGSCLPRSIYQRPCRACAGRARPASCQSCATLVPVSCQTRTLRCRPRCSEMVRV